MKKIQRNLIILVVLGLIGFAYYYVTLPAINIHSSGFWVFIISAIVAALAIYGFARLKNADEMKNSKVIKAGGVIIIVVILIYAVGSLLSSPVINAKKYQQILKVEEREFTEDIEEISFSQIPILDKASAELLGDRKMGSMVKIVSQFEASNHYTQINYQGEPVRVTPLKYASLIKWFTNRSEGIPAYIKIDMASQDVEVVQLENEIRYSDSEHFGRNIYRYLRFKYPTYIFDNINFEIDDNGVPYWVCPVKDFTIGLFGGETVGRVILLNAVTGETINYAVEDVPQWIDRVYSSELVISYYDYYGTLKHGYFNSILGQKDCIQTTDGYNYIALEDDVWLYTGVTSVTGDQSNVGFVLINQRTMETRYYSVEGATEVSAMSSAEGQVQEMGYIATFPLLLNISGEPTYFIALKDDEGLVKRYAMVNVEKYQLVAIGGSVAECEKIYSKLLVSSGISSTADSDIMKKTGIISRIAQSVIEGNSHYYIMLEGSRDIFDVDVADLVGIIRYAEGDTITIEYAVGKETNEVISIVE
ncbi:hypothetical protein [Anaerobium acetethylicum]|uniref:CvpA family protein n=1 Tax=Anaerobium acetethylicum TaxID=1619234 RepID=A0A1D3TPE2_9FIRM|nr:hypothetical protein [Anaerobium acetethylicum]SCP95262.1 hypothetical protein SAMN05421730_1001435 [Anaerobium acetethylicum]